MGRLRLPLCLALFVALALMPAAALAAPPIHEHFRETGTDVDPDFCGTGQEINISFDNRVNVWIASDSPTALVRSTISGETVFTNPDTGDSIIVSYAGQQTIEFVSGDPDGLHTVLVTTKGLPERIHTPNGPVLTRDAGLITFLFTVDGEEVVETETVVVKGPHPQADADFELFCELATEVLGIA
jgi:hypothetical protein